MKKELRYYQRDAKNAVLTALKRGRKKQLVIMPGGTGKTVVATSILYEFKGRKAWISHEEALAEQSAITVLNELDLMPQDILIKTINDCGGLVSLLGSNRMSLSDHAKLIHDNVGMVKADIFDINKPLVICSAQTLWRRLDKIPKDWFSVIIVDEGDLFGSRTFKAPIDHFTPQLLVGFTATGYRMDGMPMEDIFEEITYEYTIQQAIKDKYLTELNGIVVKTSTNLDDVHTLGGDFNQKELTEKVNTLERNNLIVNKYIEYCSGQQFICFAADVQHVIDLNEAFKEKGITTAYVVSDKDRMEIGTDRKQIVRDYKAGQLLGLINYNIFSAGFDHRDCGCVILGCPTKSKRKFLQQLFRVTRLKTEAFVKKFGQIGTILDIVDGTSKHSIVNTRELDKGLEIEDRVFVSNKNKQLLIEAREAREKEFQTTFRKEDKKIDLFKIPELKISKSFRMSEDATTAQLAVIKKWGYDIEKEVYTKHQVSEIFGKQPASYRSIQEMKEWGYDVEGKFVSVAEHQLARKEHEDRIAKVKAKYQKQANNDIFE